MMLSVLIYIRYRSMGMLVDLNVMLMASSFNNLLHHLQRN